MTTTTAPPPPTGAQIERASALMAQLLEGRRLGKKLPVAARAIGKALASTPRGSEHGQLLARAPRPAPAGGQRPDDEVAVLNLGCHGTTPTVAALANEIRDMAARRARADWLNAMAAPYAAEDGPRAAAYVATVLADAGQGPTWGRAVGRDGLTQSAVEPPCADLTEAQRDQARSARHPRDSYRLP